MRPRHVPHSVVLPLIEELLLRTDAGECAAVCLVARTRGSAPQRAGATMLVTAAGNTQGTLGGGCVEAEVRRRALELMLTGQSRMLTFNLDRDYGWDDGLVCGGAMDIAVESICPPLHARWIKLAADLRANIPTTLAIRIQDESGQTREVSHTIEPTPTLLIAGAGHVAKALSEMASMAGFSTVVIDDRPDFASLARFPIAHCIVGDIEQELRRYPIDPHTFVVIVTRGHRHDAAALSAVIESSAAYIGLIGSKRKIKAIFDALAGNSVPREAILRVHAPIGLDIGAITPGEIATSILAEMIAARRHQSANPVRPMKINSEHLAQWLDRP